MKKIRRAILLVLVCITLISCKKEGELPDTYGAELYNASIVTSDKTENRHDIPIMSKIDLSKVVDLQVETTGGTYEMEYEIQKMEYTLDDYQLYNIVLKFNQIKYEKEEISIHKIKLYTTSSQYITLCPDQCQFVKMYGEDEAAALNVIVSTLSMPVEHKWFQFDLTSEEKPIVKNISFTNKQLQVIKYSLPGTKENTSMKEFKIVPSDESAIVSLEFKPQKGKLSDYISYGTSVVFEYELDGKTYYMSPSTGTPYYNRFSPNDGTIEKYYKEVINH